MKGFVPAVDDADAVAGICGGVIVALVVGRLCRNVDDDDSVKLLVLVSGKVWSSSSFIGGSDWL